MKHFIYSLSCLHQPGTYLFKMCLRKTTTTNGSIFFFNCCLIDIFHDCTNSIHYILALFRMSCKFCTSSRL
ncbi:unnamed protein product [Schistosoma curassoni]|uniref:Ovule protein n=1 Tax=Schistosoma curassoni TaxID=6186 RepID=A0A183KYT5_9TREM|nr:unnamed protein product [Schistosoma curassoni]